MQVQPLLTQSQFLMGIGESNQFADAFETAACPVSAPRSHCSSSTCYSAGMGGEFPRSGDDRRALRRPS